MDLRRIAIFLGLNAVVSAIVTLTVLLAWDITHRNRTVGPGAEATSAPGAAVETPAGASVTDGGSGESSGGAGGTNGTTGLATITPTVYVVRPGDTLGKVAVEFDVSVEDLMAANGLTDPDVLDVGQTLIIPVGEVTTPVPTEASAPTNVPAETQILPSSPTASIATTPVPTTTKAPSAGGPQLAIRGVIGAGDVAEERVTIVNVGDDVSLAGWTLHDSQGNVFFFPALSLFQGGAVTVHTKTGTNTVTDLYWNQTSAIWQTGEQVMLVDPTGGVHTTFIVP